MPVRQISRSSWPEFLDSFSREHEGWLVTMEVWTPDQGQQVEARGLPLGGVSADLDRAPGEIAVALGRRSSAHMTHHIAAPAAVALEETEDGAHKALHVISDSGEETIVRFRVAMRSDEADGFFR